MTCRHGYLDPDCSSYKAQKAERKRIYQEERAEREKSTTPDSKAYEIVAFTRVGPHVVMKVLYPNCKECSYEGNKVMVFLNVTEADVLKWREIDPHFRDPKKARLASEAPSPAARFPASDEGWDDGVRYAFLRSPEKKP